MNLFDLFVKIKVDDEASDKVSTLSKKMGDGLKTAAKIGTAAVTAAATAVGLLTKKAVENYAEYEQLVGGVETLFKESSDTVRKYAQNAYKTSGMSANDYMSTVTSFSASLLKSLGGDTKKAAEYAQTAIVDMSDNANKMGTDMALIQNAYQGFAKANYNMLDNLKLGYGGTKEEMQRLVRDAAQLDKSIDANSLSFENVTRAIHAVQTEMGITGTTAKEAATTISGSAASMRASWRNLLTSIADDQQDFSDLVDQFIDSVLVFGDNVLPRIRTALNGVSRFIETALPRIMNEIPGIINETLPGLVRAGAGIVKSLAQGIAGNSDTIIKTVFDAARAAANALLGSAAEPIKSALTAVEGVVSRFVNFIVSHGDLVIGIISGIGAAFLTWKVASTISAVVMALQAFKTANEAATIAQAALNAVMSANPTMLIVTAIGLLAGGLALLVTATSNADNATSALSERQRDMIASAEAAAESYDKIAAAADKKAAADLAEIDYVGRLRDELLTIVDANGKVKAGYEGRARFILGELNSALGTEYAMNENLISQYDELKGSIDGVIEKKRAQILLEAHEEQYKQAVLSVTEAERARAAAAVELGKAQSELDAVQAKINEGMESGVGVTHELINQQDLAIANLEKAEEQYNSLDGTVKQYHTDIATYETASAQIIEGKTSEAVKALQTLSEGFETAASVAERSAEEQKRILGEQVVETAINAELMADAYKRGVAGVTEAMVATAQEQANTAAEEFKAVGGNITVGIEDGANGKKYELEAGMQSLVNAAVMAGKRESTGASTVGTSLVDSVKTATQNGTQPASKTFVGVISQAINNAKSKAYDGTAVGTTLGDRTKNGVQSRASAIVNTAASAVKSAISSAKSSASSANSVGRALGDGIKVGLEGRFSSIASAAASAVRQALNAAKREAGVASPAKKWRDQLGAMMAEGTGIGFVERMPKEIDAMIKAIDVEKVSRSIKPVKIPGVVGNSTAGSRIGDRTIVLTIDGHELARCLAPDMSAQLAFSRG